ncbi:MAG: tetratricopeptide repeat protein [Acidobacteriaceae bacterium]|nr:tetratricopeptide repeat protein [Acidobacteriaceae bacterium]
MLKQFLPFCLFLLAAAPARPASVLILRFYNNSEFPDLNWVGESIADTLMTELGGANEIVFSRTVRADALKRLSLRPDANYTKASVMRLGQSLDADYVCFGGFDITLPSPDAAVKDANLHIAARFIDLRKLHDGPELSETGKISELSRLQEHLAYLTIKYLQPNTTMKAEDLMSPEKTVRLDAEESYVRGLLSSNREQKQKWFTQAAALQPNFPGPVFELGKLALEQKQYAQAITWLRRIQPSDPNFAEARFKMGLAAYDSGDYPAAVASFNEVVKTYPLSEIYNDLGAAENALGHTAAATEDFRKALESDPDDSTYLFNLGTALLKSEAYQDAAKQFQQVLTSDPDDAEASDLLDRATRREPLASGKVPPQRLKNSFDETAFRQLKAVLQPGG